MIRVRLLSWLMGQKWHPTSCPYGTAYQLSTNATNEGAEMEYQNVPTLEWFTGLQKVLP